MSLIQKEMKEQDSVEPFKVCVRIRPFITKEICQSEDSLPSKDRNNIQSIFQVEDNQLYVYDPALNFSTNNRKTYSFDTIFIESNYNSDVFNRAVKPIIDNVLLGYNSTLLAYGVTGTGKTYTVFGNSSINENDDNTLNEIGVIFCFSNYLFEKLHASEKENMSKVTMSYLEIYNETVIDLLSNKPQPLMIIEDNIKGVVVHDLKEYEVNSSKDLNRFIQEGNCRRTMASTNQNQFSSRSHAILQFNIEQKNGNMISKSKFLIVDLAGSERGGLKKGLRREEGANINKSLLSLGNCINLLSDKSKKGSFIPYRDSKLTRLLKDSLGGNIATVMIACVSPSAFTYDETINTLNYATRAKKIKKKVIKNVKEESGNVSQYKDMIVSLQSEVAKLKEVIKSQEMRLNQREQVAEVEEEEEQQQQQQKEEQLSAILPFFNQSSQLKQMTIPNNKEIDSFISSKSFNNNVIKEANQYEFLLRDTYNNTSDDIKNYKNDMDSNNKKTPQQQNELIPTEDKALYDQRIEVIKIAISNNTEQNIILKFNLKEIVELNISNEQNLQLLQNQIVSLLNQKENSNTGKEDIEGINIDILKINEEMSFIKQAIRDNNILKLQLTDSLTQNVKIQKRLQHLFNNLLDSVSKANGMLIIEEKQLKSDLNKQNQIINYTNNKNVNKDALDSHQSTTKLLKKEEFNEEISQMSKRKSKSKPRLLMYKENQANSLTTLHYSSQNQMIKQRVTDFSTEFTTSPQFITQLNPDITVSSSNTSYRDLNNKTNLDMIFSERKNNKCLTNKSNQLEEARLKNKQRKEERERMISRKAEIFIKEYNKNKLLDEAMNSLANISQDSNTITIDNHANCSESIIDNNKSINSNLNDDNNTNTLLHYSSIHSLCNSIKDRKLSRYLTTNPV